jgi:hypothetical protein
MKYLLKIQLENLIVSADNPLIYPLVLVLEMCFEITVSLNMHSVNLKDL